MAKWSTRFLAWFIDVIIVSIGAVILFSIVYAPLTLLQGYNNHVPPALMGARSAIECLLLFAYWTYFELTTGQSIGKKLLNLRTTNLSGTGIDLKTALIESFGKAFLLPLDILLGWIFTNDRRQRIFNRASNTIVIKLPGNSSDIPALSKATESLSTTQISEIISKKSEGEIFKLSATLNALPKFVAPMFVARYRMLTNFDM